MSAPKIKPGDAVVFVNAGEALAATVVNVHPSGHADIEYRSHPHPKVQARGIPFCPDGGSHGWQLAPATAEDAAEPAAEAAAAAEGDADA